jgi:hypothetical protein
MLQECNFFLKSGRIFVNSMFLANILSISSPSFNVIKVIIIWIKNDLCGIIKENSNRLVTQVVA